MGAGARVNVKTWEIIDIVVRADILLLLIRVLANLSSLAKKELQLKLHHIHKSAI